jgi:hypothetical protein
VTGTVTLSEAQLNDLAELLAPRIAAALSTHATAPTELLTAKQVARRFGVTAEWARDHRDELGVIQLGDGPRPRLRFRADRVGAVLTRRSESVRSPEAELCVDTGVTASTEDARSGNAVDTLPVRQVKPMVTSQKVARRRANAPGPATRDTSSARQQRIPAAADQPSPRSTIRKERA